MLRRSSKSLLAGCTLALALATGGIQANAGATDPEITDAAGDANFVSVISGNEADARPASSDSLDLRAVWFETAYSSNKVLDSNGDVARVERVPQALLVHIRTAGPVLPTLIPFDNVRYKVQVALPGCRLVLEFVARTGSAPASYAQLGTIDACPPVGARQFRVVSDAPVIQGNEATVRFPLGSPLLPQALAAGASADQPSARVYSGTVSRTMSDGSEVLIVDQTAPGRSFTIGQDVPADVDCGSDPENAECQP
jgi:hypothetical protein